MVNAIVVKDGRILLCQRSMNEKHVPNGWCPPGGKLEETDTTWNALQRTAKREVLEETNVKVKEKMHLLINNTFRHDEDNLLVLAIVFVCYYKSGKPKPLDDTINVKWISEEEIEEVQFTHLNVKNYIFKAFEFLKSGFIL